MADCVVDTNILVEVIGQYNPSSPLSCINEVNGKISSSLEKEINKIILREGDDGYVIASSLAFIEIANQFDLISKDKFTKERFYGFLRQPPIWFLIEPVSFDTSKHFIGISKFSKKAEPIELTDAIHVATAYQRGPSTILATTDHKLHDLIINPIVVLR